MHVCIQICMNYLVKQAPFLWTAILGVCLRNGCLGHNDVLPTFLTVEPFPYMTPINQLRDPQSTNRNLGANLSS